MIKKGFTTLLFIFLFVSINSAQKLNAQTVRVNTSADSLTVGEIFQLSLVAQKTDLNQIVRFPNLAILPDAFELVNEERFVKSPSVDSLVVTLQFFGNNDTPFPPLPVNFVNQSDSALVMSPLTMIYFKSVLQSPEDELKPLKSNFDFPSYWWVYVLIGLLLAAIGYFIYKKYYKNRPVKVEPKPIKMPDFLNPINTLNAGIKQVKMDFSEQVEKDYKWFYSSLGDKIRTYLEEVYKIPALESTSRELLRYMDAFGLDKQMISYVRTILNEADLVKFAKVKPTYEQAMKALEHAQFFADRADVIDEARIRRMRVEFEQKFIREHQNDLG